MEVFPRPPKGVESLWKSSIGVLHQHLSGDQSPRRGTKSAAICPPKHGAEQHFFARWRGALEAEVAPAKDPVRRFRVDRRIAADELGKEASIIQDGWAAVFGELIQDYHVLLPLLRCGAKNPNAADRFAGVAAPRK